MVSACGYGDLENEDAYVLSAFRVKGQSFEDAMQVTEYSSSLRLCLCFEIETSGFQLV